MDEGGDRVNVVHAIAGRIRFRFPEIKGHPARARKVQQELSALPGVWQVKANPGTGSVLVTYDHSKMDVLLESSRERFPALYSVADDVRALLAPAVEELEIELGLAETIMGFFRGVNSKVSKITGGPDLRVLVPVALFLLGVRGLLFSKKTGAPGWSTLLWFSFATFIALNKEATEPGTQLEGEGENVP